MPRALATSTFASFDGCTLAYHEAGSGAPVVLLHGFAADTARNWVEPGVLDALCDAGRRVVALDARGHGASDKPHEPDAYRGGAMARDVQTLLDHLELDHPDVCGYSMGAITTLQLLARDARARSVVLGGIGSRVLEAGLRDRSDELADALEAEDPGGITNPTAKAFRAFADATGADRRALAAIQRSRRGDTVELARTLEVPGLVVAGNADELLGSAEGLAEQLGAKCVLVPGNHLTAVYAPRFTTAIVEFLGG